MKKRIALLLALALIAACGVTLAGCGGRERDLVGQWTAELDLTDGAREALQAGVTVRMGDLAEFLDAGDLLDLDQFSAQFRWTITLREDQSMTMAIDASDLGDSMEAALAGVKDKLAAAIPAVLEPSFTRQGLTMDQVEAILADQDMTLDDMVTEMAQEVEASFQEEAASLRERLDTSAEEDGFYTVDGDRIYLLGTKDTPPNDAYCLTYQRKGGALVVTDMPQTFQDLFAALLPEGEELLPITFTR